MRDPEDELSLADALHLDQLADEFENAFQAGNEPSLVDFLQRSHLPRRIVLRELLRIDRELRQSVGQSLHLADYLEQFPFDQSSVRAAFEDDRSQSRTSSENSTTQPTEDDRAVDIPARIGRYEIRRRVGRGGFGVVYLAHDTQLDRLVALKLPKAPANLSDEQIANFLREASVAASLKHPCLVSVFDVQLNHGQPFIVYEYVQGESLASWAARQQLAFQQIVRLLIQITDALGYAHQQGVIHCDLKLANILIDQAAQPRIADFGLAIRDQLAAPGYQISGTPLSMAPEQIRGDQRLLDARTDIWALGVMLYELLLGRRPFYGRDYQELYDRIQHAMPEPPVQIDPSLPEELSRICLKCLAKEPADRYQNAAELRQELESWLGQAGHGQVSRSSLEAIDGFSDVSALPLITPRGLRAFGANDHGFYASLLPGPRDRYGLPESIAFWKRKLESRVSGELFSVGLIYGPSGSGKSSLAQAGIIPHLDADKVTVVNLDASADGTEAMLLRRLADCATDQPAPESLSQAISILRQTPGSRKIVIFLDQFEQWLQIHHDYAQSELVRGLRLCNGTDVQAVVIVRDEFFASVNLFFQQLQLPLHEGHNYTLVPRFSAQHAEFVLTQFGRAFGSIPAAVSAESTEISVHQEFVRDAVTQLAEGNGLTCVRIALFAETMKHRRWVPDTLREFGGMDGLGAAYLEDKISGTSAGPIARSHERAIRQVLRELLPPLNCDIRGAVRRESWLRQAAGCDSTEDWQAIIGILDRDLRLITPIDPFRECEELDERGLERSYQLTHDYLVPLLRNWLTRKQRETRRGRAELKLSELAEMWRAQPTSRFLPGFFEWAEFQCFTSRKQWTATQAAFMSRANRKIGWVVTLLCMLLGCASFLTWERLRQRDVLVRQTLSQVMTAELGKIPELVSKSAIAPYRLRSELDSLQIGGFREQQSIRIDLALLPIEPNRVESIRVKLLELDPEEIESLRPVLIPQGHQMVDFLWQETQRERTSEESVLSFTRRLLAASSFLAQYADPNDARWQSIVPAITQSLLNMNVENNRGWARLYRPVGRHLSPLLNDIRREETMSRIPNSLDRPYSPQQLDLAVDILVDLAGEDVGLLGELLFTGLPAHFERVFPSFAKQPNLALDLARQELKKNTTFRWPDMDWSASPIVKAAWVAQVQQASGLLHQDFAFVQTLLFSEFEDLTRGLAGYGYRPIRLRPYPSDGQLLATAVWARDGRKSDFRLSLTQDELSAIDSTPAVDGLIPVDVAGYVLESGAQLDDRFCLLFAEPTAALAGFRVYGGVAEQQQWKTEFNLANGQHRIASSIQCYQAADGKRRYCGIIAKQQDESSTTYKCQSPRDLESHEDWDRIHADISLCPLDALQTAQAYYGRIVNEWKLDHIQDWTNSHNRPLLLAEAYFQTRDYAQAMRECNYVIATVPHVALPYLLRSRMRAVQAKQAGTAEKQAELTAGVKDDLSKYARLCKDPTEAIAARALACGHLGESAAHLDELAGLARSAPENAELQLRVATSYAGCSAVLRASEDASSGPLEAKALEYLNLACQAGFQDWIAIYRNADWSHLVARPELLALVDNTPLQVYYTGARCTSRTMDSTVLHGLSLAEHLQRCQQLTEQGFRPAAMSVGDVKEQALCASVWQRPMVAQDDLEEMSIRHANAGVAAYRLGSPSDLWPLLKRHPDPRLRTRVIHTLGPARCDPLPFVHQLFEELDDSQKFAILQSLGEMELSQLDRDRISPRVLRWFEFEVDAGVHGACEWLLKQWGLTDAIDEVHLRLATGRRDGRRWYRDELNLFTFACIDGPVEYLRGMPRNTLAVERLFGETRIPTRINRSFAIATTEVTLADIQRLHDVIQVTRPFDENQRATQNSAAGGINWVIAGLFCQYLDHQQRTPRKQWCFTYIGEDKEPIELAADYLSRTGYRLPTRSEWEYVARAGVMTKRHFGEYTTFIDAYAWYGHNSAFKLQPVGIKKPNDFGLFDTLGNVEEWLMTRDYPAYGMGPINDDIEDPTPYSAAEPRAIRGSSYSSIPTNVSLARAAQEYPRNSGRHLGMRLTRTLPQQAD